MRGATERRSKRLRPFGSNNQGKHPVQIASHTTLARHWAMLRAIPRWPQTITVAALKSAMDDDGFRPGRTTVDRDLAELARHFPITADTSGKTHRWSWAKGASIEFLPSLTVPQCLALTLAQQQLRDLLPQTMFKALGPVFEVAKRELAKSDWKEWPNRTAVAPPAFTLLPPKINAKVLADVQNAINRRLCMTAKYRSKGTKVPRMRSINPLGLLVRGTVQYLICLLPEYKDEPRQLCLHRMSATTLGTERCRELHGFTMRRYARKITQDSKGTIRLRLLMDETSAEHIRETPLSTYQTWRPVAGTKKVEVGATVDEDVELKRWLLSLGSEAQVLAPEHLRAWMGEELRRAAGAYGE